jgi:two-component system, OmpR family, copper resistance phosphate regulon response regulator CusR
MDQERILVIEDEPKIANSLKAGLIENGFDVDVAYAGDEGLKFFKGHNYHLVILDINLPVINGYELCKKFRETNAQVPIIIITSLVELDDKIKGYDMGADDFIVKPFEFKELLLKIKVFLKRTGTHVQPSKILRAGDLEMNLDSKEVRRNEQPINLTAKEFQLLEYLLLNKNKVVSRNEIAINVWEIDFDTNTNVIDVYINYLRNKVDKPFDQKLIQTQVGMGYILKES